MKTRLIVSLLLALASSARAQTSSYYVPPAIISPTALTEEMVAPSQARLRTTAVAAAVKRPAILSPHRAFWGRSATASQPVATGALRGAGARGRVGADFIEHVAHDPMVAAGAGRGG